MPRGRKVDETFRDSLRPRARQPHRSQQGLPPTVTQKNPTILNLAMKAMRFSSSRTCVRHWTRRARDFKRTEAAEKAGWVQNQNHSKDFSSGERHGDALFP